MLKHLRPALVMIVAFTALTGLVYPLAMTGIAQALFPDQANGSLIEDDGKVVGSDADRPELHQRPLFPRPAVGDFGARSRRPGQVGHNALQRRQFDAAPTSARQRGADRRASRPTSSRLQGREPGTRRCRSDLVTTSGSGLDPHISPEAALFQVPRVAKARGLPEERVRPSSTATSKAASSASGRARRQRAAAQPARSMRLA